ncbi:histidine--tRNA ligase [Candidatus Saccharibacteria bacterium]|nr:histidine--tRNA ligase [Candidatus Saccharibacteria bacterium]
MSLSTQPYKGARDFYPEDKRLQKQMFSVWRNVVESFGYEEYDAPVLEPTELYASKTSDEIVNEQTYSFTDRGGRNITMRTEMTPSVSRMVAARRQEFGYPLRLYSIPNLWRYERPQKGRLREFWQLNVDLFGVDNILAEFEMIQISSGIMSAFEAQPNMYQVKINSRKLINYLLEDHLKINDVQSESLIRLIDKKDKMSGSEFSAKLNTILDENQRQNNVGSKLLNILSISTIEDLPIELKQHESSQKLTELINLCNNSSINNVVFDLSLMRGFDYYTDIVFEVFDTHPENNRSMFGGGRYDGLIGEFGVEPVPTVGFGMGDATLYNFLFLHNLLPKVSSSVEVYAAVLTGNKNEALRLINELREMGVNVAADFSGNKLEKQIKNATKKTVPYMLFVGDNEVESGQFKLKNLSSGKEEAHSLQRIVSIVKDYRNNDSN